MRTLAYLSPARGHLFPTIPVLAALRDRGHETHVRTLAGEVERVRALGISADAIAPPIEAIEQSDHTGSGQRARLRLSLDTLARRAEHEVADLGEALERHRPEVLLVDVNAWGAQAVAEASGLPWAVLIPYPVPLSDPLVPPFGPGLPPARGAAGHLRDRLLRPLITGGFARELLPRVNAARATAGVPALTSTDELVLRSPLALYFSAEPFEYPRSAWPESFRLVGPCAWEPPAAPPAWLDEDDRPLALISTSSEYQGDEALVRAAFDALAGRDDLRVVATLPSADPQGLAVPANARLERFCPHGPLLQRAAVVVCHGGMGVTQKALASGVPVCAVPFGRDQLEVARRVEASGAGTRLPARRLSAERLRSAIDGAVARRAGAERVAAAFAAAGGASAAADAVETLVRTPAPVAPSRA